MSATSTLSAQRAWRQPGRLRPRRLRRPGLRRPPTRPTIPMRARSSAAWSSTTRPSCAGTIRTAEGRAEVQGELVRVLTDGPGVIVFKGAYEDLAVVDRATDAFHALIAEQRASGITAGDHFAKPGANDRVWNALEKLAVSDPETFVAYYANDIINLVSRRLARARLSGDLADQRRQSRRRGPDRAPRLPPRLHERAASGRLPHPRPPAVPRTDPAGCRRALGHAGRERSHDVPAALAQVRRRLPRLPPSGVPGLLRRALRPAPAGQGRRGLLQPGRLPWRRDTTARPTSAGWPTCLQVSSAFGRAMESIDRTRVSLAVFDALKAMKAAGAAMRRSTTRSRQPLRATRSRPTSISTSLSTAWLRPTAADLLSLASPRSGTARSSPHD